MHQYQKLNSTVTVGLSKFRMIPQDVLAETTDITIWYLKNVPTPHGADFG